jgi:hypothetical protein
MKLFKEIHLKKLWNSPTLNSWGSYGSRSLSMLVILPLLLVRLSTTEIAVWFLFMTIMGLQLLIEGGFGASFSRVIAYAMGGATKIDDMRDPSRKYADGRPNWDFVGQIVSTAHRVYLWLGIGWIALLFVFGTIAVNSLVSKLEHPMYGWIAWTIVILTSGVRLYGAKYSVYLLGINEVAVLRRWEMITWLAIAPCSIIVLLSGGGILSLVAVMQFIVVTNVIINWKISRTVQNKQFQKLRGHPFQKKLFSRLWPTIWRSAVGVIMITGLVQLTAIFYAQVGTVQNVASYLLALNILRMLTQFSQAPFYSKLPLLARLRPGGGLRDQQILAARGMRLSHWTLVVGIIVVGVIGPFLVTLMDSNAAFVKGDLWVLMGLAAFMERHGAMHLQLYSTTNHIVWHIANGVTGAIYLIIVFPLYSFVGVYALPLTHFISIILFYDWYCATKSYRAFSLKRIEFEMKTSILPFIILLAYFLTTLEPL